MENNQNSVAPAKDPMPVDPSRTSDIGEKVDQDVVKIKEGLDTQSNKAADKTAEASG